MDKGYTFGCLRHIACSCLANAAAGCQSSSIKTETHHGYSGHDDHSSHPGEALAPPSL